MAGFLLVTGGLAVLWLALTGRLDGAAHAFATGNPTPIA